MNYYNEFHPPAAAMLRQLIADKLIPEGHVDDRSITEVTPGDLAGYIQCHFFAGIGGWPLALQLAGWSPTRSVWTGSCPCQPFSTAGNQKGKADERHLWPVWFNLIRQSRPDVVFGEQVSAAIRHGWWDDVADDLEREGYTTRAEIRPACSVGAPHRRERLWFVANANSGCSTGRLGSASGKCSANISGREEQTVRCTDANNVRRPNDGDCNVANSDIHRCPETGQRITAAGSNGITGDGSTLAHAESGGRGVREPTNIGATSPQVNAPTDDCASCDGKTQAFNVAHTECQQNDEEQRGPEAHERGRGANLPSGCGVDCSPGSMAHAIGCGQSGQGKLGQPSGSEACCAGEASEPWDDCARHWKTGQWIPCPDGKQRLIEPSICLLAHGFSERVACLHGFGNAIVPQVAAEFIKGLL